MSPSSHVLATNLGVNQNPDNQKLAVSYEGEDYEAIYSISDGCLEVEVLLDNGPVSQKTPMAPERHAASLARMMAWEILRTAKERGELD